MRHHVTKTQILEYSSHENGVLVPFDELPRHWVYKRLDFIEISINTLIKNDTREEQMRMKYEVEAIAAEWAERNGLIFRNLEYDPIHFNMVFFGKKPTQQQ